LKDGRELAEVTAVGLTILTLKCQ